MVCTLGGSFYILEGQEEFAANIEREIYSVWIMRREDVGTFDYPICEVLFWREMVDVYVGSFFILVFRFLVLLISFFIPSLFYFINRFPLISLICFLYLFFLLL